MIVRYNLFILLFYYYYRFCIKRILFIIIEMCLHELFVILVYLLLTENNVIIATCRPTYIVVVTIVTVAESAGTVSLVESAFDTAKLQQSTRYTCLMVED